MGRLAVIGKQQTLGDPRGTRVGAVTIDDEASLAGAVGDGHPERVEQREVVLGGAPGRREVVADDQRVGTGEDPHRLELAEHSLPSAREPQPRAGQHETEERDRLERLARRKQ